jgi:hypothetical protein
MKNQELPVFAQYLRESRIKAGFKSLAEAVSAANKSKLKGAILSKAKLSQYERGVIDTIKPEVMRLLAATYQVHYQELAQRWFNDRYCLEQSKNSKIVVNLPALGQVNLTANDEQIGLISLEALKSIQADVPKGTRVIVSAIRFLDDTIFFDMVLNNINKGVIYYYLQPESQRLMYQHLLTKIDQALPGKKNKIDGIKTFFIPRVDFESPINQVLMIYPSGEVKGYIGLLGDDIPACYQLLKNRLAMRLFNALLWTIRMAKSPEIMREIKLLEGRFGNVKGTNMDSPGNLLESIFAIS